MLIFGNSSSGKSTLAKEIARCEKIAHLDLDTIAWLPETPPERMPLDVSNKNIKAFITTHKNWVIEGCYTDLFKTIRSEASQIIFMNLDISRCIENAKNRPWEPHKYATKKAQDENLEMLIEWIKQYFEREDVCSYKAHTDFYEDFSGNKIMYLDNEKNTKKNDKGNNR